MRRLVGSLALALVCSGCFTLDCAESPLLAPDADAYVVVRNYGWNLFGFIPLVCGNADIDSFWGSTFFKDEVKPEVAYSVLAKCADERNRAISDLAVFDDHCVFFSLPIINIPLPIPWVVQYKEVCISAMIAPEGDRR